MNYEFDFNINNYSVSEVEKFLNLDEKYDLNNINEHISSMKIIIKDSKDYDRSYKSKLMKFLDEAKLMLVKHIKNVVENNDGFIEDYDKLLIPSDEGRVVNKTSIANSGNKFVMIPETTSLNNVIGNDKNLEPMESFPTNISRSSLNTLKRKAIYQTVVLNTVFREDYFNSSSTDFTIVLPYYFKNVLSLRLSSLQLPNVIYCISKANGNNNFYIEEEDTDISGTIIFPDGNYNDIAIFANVLQHEINSQLGISPDRFIVTYDINSHKITISNTTFDFSMIFNTPISPNHYKYKKKYNPTALERSQNCVELDQIYKKFGWIMGFRSDTYRYLRSYTTEAVYNGAYPNYIYFVLNDFNNSQAQNVFGMYSKSIIGDNILGMIPITASSFYVNFTNGGDLIEKRREYFGPVRIQRLKIQLLNQYGEPINLNNMDYSFSLEMEIGYDI